MIRLLSIVGLTTALACAVLGAALLVVPAQASAPAFTDAVAPAPLDLPEDHLWHPSVALATVPTLLDGTRVRVPRLGIDVALQPGDVARDIDAQSTPAGAAFLLPGSAVPGTSGNAYVYAHARTGLFLSLWNARLGDVIQVIEPSGAVLSYVVREIHPRVDPVDLRYVAPSPDERITLQTSTGPWPLNPRFVVVAVRQVAP